VAQPARNHGVIEPGLHVDDRQLVSEIQRDEIDFSIGTARDPGADGQDVVAERVSALPERVRHLDTRERRTGAEHGEADARGGTRSPL